jgi:hypothetical protein
MYERWGYLSCSEEQFVLAKLIFVLIFYEFCNNVSAGRSEIVSGYILGPAENPITGVKIVVSPPADKMVQKLQGNDQSKDPQYLDG